jgi:hypothetical protein
MSAQRVRVVEIVRRSGAQAEGNELLAYEGSVAEPGDGLVVKELVDGQMTDVTYKVLAGRRWHFASQERAPERAVDYVEIFAERVGVVARPDTERGDKLTLPGMG